MTTRETYIGFRVYLKGPEVTTCVVSPVGLTTVPWRPNVLAPQIARPKGSTKRARPSQRLQVGQEITTGQILVLPRPQLRRSARMGIPGGKGNFRGSFGASDAVVAMKWLDLRNLYEKKKGDSRRPLSN